MDGRAESERGRAELVTADAMAAVYASPCGGRALIFGGLLGIIARGSALIIGASRLLFAMARGGMLPATFARLHPRYESPVAVIVLLTALSMLAPFFGRHVFVWLVGAGGLATVLGYLFVAVSFLELRKSHPELERSYRVPAAKLVGTLALFATVFFICLYLPGSPSALIWPQEWVIVLIWALLGVAFFLIARGRVSEMGRDQPRKAILGDYAGKL